MKLLLRAKINAASKSLELGRIAMKPRLEDDPQLKGSDPGKKLVGKEDETIRLSHIGFFR